MINGNLDQFLDTGWFNEATLFYNGHLYWCEATIDEKSQKNVFFVERWRAENENNECYHSLLNKDGQLDYERIYEDSDIDIELIKKRFLEADIWDGKTFWQIESEIAWLDDGGDVKCPQFVS